MKEIKSLPVKRQVSVSGILKKLGVSRSGYNAWKKRVPSDTSVRRAVLKEKIQKIYEESHQNYGAPKITAELRKSGEYVSEKTVGNYMRQMGIKAHWVKPYIQTTIDSDFSQKLKNILNEEFNPAHPDAVWCSDITYIWTFEGFVYLTSVMDLYSRKIISWVLSETLEASHVVECVEKAKRVRNVEKPLIFHCDRGCQYVSEAFQKATKDMIRSYSKKAYPWDNACIESFHALLKREWINRFKIFNYAHAHKLIFEYIETFYNTVRPHSALDLAVPASVYTESLREFPKHISDWDYGTDCKLCKVKQNGYFNFEGQGYFLSEAFQDKYIAVRESHLPGQITLLFRQFRIGRIDREKRVYTMKRIYRLSGDPRETV